MRSNGKYPCGGMNRRHFLAQAGAGVLLGSTGGIALGAPVAGDGMPGPYPGKVVEVHHPGSVSDDFTINPPAVTQMVQKGMCDLTGADHVSEAWKKFFEKDDVVGIKVNPVGRRYDIRKAQSVSSLELVIECVEGLKSVGIPARNIVLFERYADQFRDVYDALLREKVMDGVRWYASSSEYTDTQLDIEGYDHKRDMDDHVVGYDPDVFIFQDYFMPAKFHHPKDDRRFRSHLSVIATRMVNKIINLPVLKDHGTGGVTGALKNLSHGLNNNVARSHCGKSGAAEEMRDNQNDVFIPAAAGQELIRKKVVLNIMDGLIGVWQGGPASTSGCVWAHRRLFFSTDPVAMDRIAWGILDVKRLEKGRPILAKSGTEFKTPGEQFSRRHPEHVCLAGKIGLGVFDLDKITHKKIELNG